MRVVSFKITLCGNSSVEVVEESKKKKSLKLAQIIIFKFALNNKIFSMSRFFLLNFFPSFTTPPPAEEEEEEGENYIYVFVLYIYNINLVSLSFSKFIINRCPIFFFSTYFFYFLLLFYLFIFESLVFFYY